MRYKLTTMIVIGIFAVGMIISAADAAHTFKKGKYKMTISNKKYRQLKSDSRYDVTKRVGTKKIKKTKKTGWIKRSVFREYFSPDEDGYEIYTGCRVFKYNKKYNGSKYDWIATKYKTVKHYRADGTLKYEDEIEYEQYRYIKVTKKPVYMFVYYDSDEHKFVKKVY